MTTKKKTKRAKKGRKPTAKVTSKRVASSAGRLLAKLQAGARVLIKESMVDYVTRYKDITNTIESILASALVQRETKGGRK